MNILDRLPGRQAAAKLQQLSEQVSSLRASSDAKDRTLRHVRSELNVLKDELREDLPLDIERGRAGPFVGGQWEEVNGAVNSRAKQIVKAREGYAGTYRTKGGQLFPWGTSRRVVDMHSEYCFGGGVEAPTVSPKEGDTQAEALERAIRDWWFYAPNQEVAFDMESQLRLSGRLLVDGLVAFALFAPGAGRPMAVRIIDVLQLGQPVTAPDDSSKVLYWTRKYAPTQWDAKTGTYGAAGTQETLYYQDVDLSSSDDIEDPYADALKDKLAVDKFGNPVRLLVIGDGYSIMHSMMVWENLFNALATDQCTISAATAALALRASVEGGQADVDAAVTFLGQSGDNPTTAPPNPGNWTVTNEAVKFDIGRAQIGASEANLTRRLVQMPLAALAGVSLHYIGDPENANLATASAMEGPQLKHFVSYQGRWANAIRKLTVEALRGHPAVEDPRDLNITVPMPDIVLPDLMDRVDAIKSGREQGFATKQQGAMLFWQAMGAADPTQEVATAMEEADAEADEEEEVDPALLAAQKASPVPGQFAPKQPEVPGAYPRPSE
jgi:hypothetical protein